MAKRQLTKPALQSCMCLIHLSNPSYFLSLSLSAIGIQNGAAGLKKSSPGPRPGPPRGPQPGMSMMEQIQAKQQALAAKKVAGGGSSPPPPPGVKAAPKGFNQTMLANVNKGSSSPKRDESDDEGWSDNEEDAMTAKPVIRTGLGKPTASKAPTTSAKPPKINEATSAKPPPPAPAAKPPAQKQTWKEKEAARKEALKKAQDEERARRASKFTPASRTIGKPPPLSTASKPPPPSASKPPPPSMSKPFKSRSSAAASSAEVESLKDELSKSQVAEKSLNDENAMLKKKIDDLESERNTLVKRIEEVEAGPGKQRRDSAAFQDSISLMAQKTEDLDQARKDLVDARKTISDLQRSASRMANQTPSGVGLDMGELKSLREQLFRTKKEKEKALKLVVKLVGKDNLARHMKLHETTGDGLAALVNSYGGTGVGKGSPRGRSSHRSPSPIRKSSPQKAYTPPGSFNNDSKRSNTDKTTQNKKTTMSAAQTCKQ